MVTFLAVGFPVIKLLVADFLVFYLLAVDHLLVNFLAERAFEGKRFLQHKKLAEAKSAAHKHQARTSGIIQQSAAREKL